MPFEITMPQLGLTMETGAVVEWLIGEGEPFAAGQELLQVETDKAVVAVEAHAAGVLAHIFVPAGQSVPVGAVLAVATAPGEALPAGWQPAAVAASRAAAPLGSPALPAATEAAIRPSAPAGPLQASWKARDMARQAGLDLRLLAGSGPGGRVVAADVVRAFDAGRTLASAPAAAAVAATPVAARLAEALGLDLRAIPGSGPQGRITQADVLAAAAAIIQHKRRPELAAPGGPAPGLPQVAAATPLKGVRRIVSEGMAHSVHTTARVTLFREVDVSELAKLRSRLAAQDLDISYNDLLIHICAVALRDHPEANARLGDGQVEQLDRINIGLAVDTDRGLLVPVIHGADRLTLPQIAAQRARLVQAARDGCSHPDDLSGGTFTITNLGMLGVEGFTPVINLPECCILGVGSIVRKPVACGEGDEVAVRPMMTLSLVFDHRVIDGAPAARFLDRIARLVQDPLLLLLLDN